MKTQELLEQKTYNHMCENSNMYLIEPATGPDRLCSQINSIAYLKTMNSNIPFTSQCNHQAHFVHAGDGRCLSHLRLLLHQHASSAPLALASAVASLPHRQHQLLHSSSSNRPTYVPDVQRQQSHLARRAWCVLQQLVASCGST